MTTADQVSESVRKRARTGEATSVIIKNSASNVLRANEISTRLSALLKDLPEIKFIFDFENLQGQVETAVMKYAEEKEAKKRNALLSMNYGQDTKVPLYSLPDEALSNCLSFVGKGHYGVLGLVSKKLNEAYKEEFGQETAYLEMATSFKLANYCLNDLCKSLEEKDEILKAAAVNGNVDILRAAVKDGYDLFPLISMKKGTFTEYEYDSVDEEDDSDSERNAKVTNFDVFHIDENEEKNSLSSKKVNLSKLVQRGHLHVLKYLYEELNYFLGLQRYCYSAIQLGQLEILEWLDYITVMKSRALHLGYTNNGSIRKKGFCEYAIKCGNVEVLHWLRNMNYEISSVDVLPEAISSKAPDMIQYCFDLGYDNLTGIDVQYAIKGTKSVEVYRKMHELGYEFGEMKKWYTPYYFGDYFEIIKFLRNISIPWNNGIMKDIVEYGTLEMIQYARDDGCPWTTSGDEYTCLLRNNRWILAGSRNNSWSLDKLNYLIGNGCIFNYYRNPFGLINALKGKKELVLLEYFVGKNANFDNNLFRGLLNTMWIEGISYLLENGKDAENFKSIETIFRDCTDIAIIKYFHGLGFTWCFDSSRNTHLLSKIACYNKLDDVKWAYENGCKGGYLVPFVEEEWKENGIRKRDQWKENQIFFVENGMLDKTFLGKSKLTSKKVQEIGDTKIEILSSIVPEKPYSAWFIIRYSLLRTWVEHGYTFRSMLEKESVIQEAYIKCCESGGENRKILVLFLSMGVREL